MTEASKLKELAIIADEIETELSRCEHDLKGVGTLSIKIQSLNNMLRKEEQQNSNIRQLNVRAKYFLTQIRMLSERCATEREKMEREMEESKIKVKKISETCDPDQELKERNFYSKQSTRLDDFISTTMDSLDSLKRQGVLIQRVNDKLKSGLTRLGVSGEFIDKIEKRFGRDKMLFTMLFVILVIFILFLRFIFK